MSINVNLARKWRSRTFDQVIGQEISVRILKNSLYLNHFFPVYLFSGQHGCGKTTTARIFATAANCEQLDSFQKDPKKFTLPCLACTSCLAMQAGNHPDFIEIDGASHTGVDNVRHIIDVAAFLPLMGKKKIYLIDEAHMLSKAAFNAFLKILEEPPPSVLFMLATTELYKIIDTVRSRSFHIFFRSVAPEVLLQHLETICKEEGINYEQRGLLGIIKHTHGSVRDALNVLEQVRFESNRVTKDNVLKVLGCSDDETIIALFELIVFNNPEDVLDFIRENALDRLNAGIVWKSLLDLLNECVLVLYKVKPRNFVEYRKSLEGITKVTTALYFNDCLTLLYEHELIFAKTSSAWHLLEMLLVRMCQNSKAGKQSVPAQKTTKNLSNEKADNSHVIARPSASNDVRQAPSLAPSETTDATLVQWNSFIQQIELLDPLLSSIFKQGRYGRFDASTNSLVIIYAKEFTFFNEMLESSSAVWKPLLTSLIGKPVEVQALFQENEVKVSTPKVQSPTVQPFVKGPATPVRNESSLKRENQNKMEKNMLPERSVDISDKEQWKKATLLQTMFAGTLQELQEGHDE